jgi:hypothetical protein
MFTSFAKRFAAFSVIAVSVFAAVPAGGAVRSATVVKPAASMILCQPGFVYRCGPHGCFCVKA